MTNAAINYLIIWAIFGAMFFIVYKINKSKFGDKIQKFLDRITGNN